MILRNTKRWVRQSGRSAWRLATASKRTLPHFLLIGAQKSGTSSLYRYLAEHPDVLPAAKKEVHYFDAPDYEKGPNWYRSHFPLVSEILRQNVITGEASPYYIFQPHCPQRVARLIPKAKLIVILRNPIDRAFSHYQQMFLTNREPLSFEEALATEEERLAGEEAKILANDKYYSHNYWAHSYKTRGQYANQILHWQKYFPPEQLLFILSENFFKNTEAEYQRVLAFLGLSSHTLDQYEKRHSRSYDAMKPETREALREYFRPHNEKLSSLLNLDIDWD